MSIEMLFRFLMWCSVINYALIGVWAVIATVGRDWGYTLVRGKIPISREQYDLVNYAGITLYKTGTLLLNIVPLLSLYIIK